MHSLMLFKLGTRMKNDGLHTNFIYFRDQIQDGRLVAPLLLKRAHNHFSDTHSPILFKLATSTAHCGIYVHLTSFCDLIKDGRLVDLRPF